MATGQIDKKYLAGLKFNTSEPKEVEVNGKKRINHIPVERALTQDEVLSWKEYEDRVVIVAKDGKKHVVKKAEDRGQKTEGGKK